MSGPLTASMIAVARCFAQPNFKVCICLQKLFTFKSCLIYIYNLSTDKLNTIFFPKIEIEQSIFMFLNLNPRTVQRPAEVIAICLFGKNRRKIGVIVLLFSFLSKHVNTG